MSYLEVTDLPTPENVSGSGQGEDLLALSKTPVAKEHCPVSGIDTAHIVRFDCDKTLCQWFGRRRDGYFYPFGPVYRIVPTTGE